MSLNRTVKVSEVSREVILEGARAYKVSVHGDFLEFGINNNKSKKKVRLSKDGALVSDFAGITHIGSQKLTQEGDMHGMDIGEELHGRMFQAGITASSGRTLQRMSFHVTMNILEGTLRAQRGSEWVTLNTNVDGTIAYDANNFEGKTCNLVFNDIQKAFGKFKVVKTKSKVQPIQVVNTTSNS